MQSIEALLVLPRRVEAGIILFHLIWAIPIAVCVCVRIYRASPFSPFLFLFFLSIFLSFLSISLGKHQLSRLAFSRPWNNQLIGLKENAKHATVVKEKERRKRMKKKKEEREEEKEKRKYLYEIWNFIIRYLAPISLIEVFLYASGLL